jgi:hypothetical protein
MQSRKVQNTIKNTGLSFDALLDKALDKARKVIPDDWGIILNYIDSQATITPKVLNLTIDEAAKEAYGVAKVSKIVYRLTNSKEE